MEIGPILPPYLAKKLNSSREEKNVKFEEKQSSGEERKQTEDNSDRSDDEEETYGPALPPGFQKNKETGLRTRVIGPMRPQFDADQPPTITSNGL